MLIDQVYYINVDSFKDRREYMQKQFDRELMLAERFSAFHPTTTAIADLINDKLIAESVVCNITNDIISRQDLDNLYAKAFENETAVSHIFTLFTAASHGALWRKVSLMPEGSIALILEDDVMFLVKDFWENIHLHLEHLPEDYDIAFFACWKLCATPINDFFSIPNKEKGKCNLWTNCYVINQKGAKKLFDMFFPYSRTAGIDVDMRDNYDKFNIYFSNTALATQRRDILHEAGHPVFFSARDVFSENKHKLNRPLKKEPVIDVLSPSKKNYIASTLFTTCKDPANEYKLKQYQINFKSGTVMDAWCRSALKICQQHSNVQLAVFYDQIHPEIFKKYSSKHIEFINVADCGAFDPYEYRWVVYKQFLQKNLDLVKNIFFTDISDVLVKQNPFLEMKKGILYVGSQPEKWSKKWLRTRTMYYMERVDELKEIYDKWRNIDALNAGLLGGESNLVLDFLNKMVKYIEKTTDLQTGATDMILFNYVLRRYFPNTKSGFPIHSVFWKEQKWRDDVWFVHK